MAFFYVGAAVFNADTTTVFNVEATAFIVVFNVDVTVFYVALFITPVL